MDIYWLGHSCFRLKGKQATVFTDPFEPSLGIKMGKQEADMVCVSHASPNHAFESGITGAHYTLKGPGEYEISGVAVQGVPSWQRPVDEEKKPNTCFRITLDDVHIVHMGDIGVMLDDLWIDVLGSIDVLMVPVGGGNAYDASEAAAQVRALSPRIVIPMHYKLPNLKVELDDMNLFLKEMGVESTEALPKLSVAGAGSSDGESKVVILEARN